ncbi:hypothetical protein AERO8C_70608 [Aeromonas veronii]|uniref:Uncharacterized protein n=1 Tax=Aeromonas veronii TaxID=654 RepID=A0A653LBI2_AERVE|nr:hypothetical protein AERO8C_70608 [Aeromonas veronii]
MVSPSFNLEANLLFMLIFHTFNHY